MEKLFANLPADFTMLRSEYIGFLRFALPALMGLLLLRCFLPLLTFRREPEIWAWLCLKDGSRLPITHWENIWRFSDCRYGSICRIWSCSWIR